MHQNLLSGARQGHPETLDRRMKLKTKERLRMELALSGLPQKALAYGTGTDEAQMARMLGERYEEALPAHKIPSTVRELGPGFMEWLALQCNGIYVHGGELTLLDSPTSSALVGLLAQHAGLTVQMLIEHFEDHVWTGDEKREVIPLLRKLRQIVDTLLSDAEGGRE